nr:hypothetical protein BaRGS_026331 [Batillaria attramentaria]
MALLPGEFSEGIGQAMSSYGRDGSIKTRLDILQIDYKCCKDDEEEGKALLEGDTTTTTDSESPLYDDIGSGLDTTTSEDEAIYENIDDLGPTGGQHNRNALRPAAVVGTYNLVSTAERFAWGTEPDAADPNLYEPNDTEHDYPYGYPEDEYGQVYEDMYDPYGEQQYYGEEYGQYGVDPPYQQYGELTDTNIPAVYHETLEPYAHPDAGPQTDIPLRDTLGQLG